MRLEGVCGGRVGSAGTSGDLEKLLRLPDGFWGLAMDGTPARGGEYCVPTSTVSLVGRFVERLDVDNGRLWGFDKVDCDGAGYRGNAAGDGGLMYGRGDEPDEKRYDPWRERAWKPAGEVEVVVEEWSVGEGDDVIISKSSSDWFLLLRPVVEKGLRCIRLPLVCANRARAYL